MKLCTIFLERMHEYMYNTLVNRLFMDDSSLFEVYNALYYVHINAMQKCKQKFAEAWLIM